MLLADKKILVAVTGSIAVYKSLELIRLYIKAGASVRVIMTKAAQKFVTPLSFEAISQNKVLTEDSESWDKSEIYNHIDIGKWADIFVIAPCSANSINKFANGIADNLLTQTVLAYPRLKLLAPAANTNMLKNPITQESLKKLQSCNFELVDSLTKELVCKDVGDGAMAEPQTIFYETCRALYKDEYWLNRKVVLSGGGTLEKIDDVRYISNFSSGKMAASLALALYFKGAEVSLVASRGYEDLPKQIHTVKALSSYEMYESLVDNINLAKKGEKKPFLFMVAAVSDYLPESFQEGKLKKEILGNSWSLKLKQNMDILNSLDKKGLVSIGFKAEMDGTVAFDNAQNMLEKKSLDGVCLNILENSNSFGSSENKIELILKDKSKSFSGDKLSLSIQMLEFLKEEFVKFR